MPHKKFLETYPLYKKLRLEFTYSQTRLHNIAKPAVNMFCKKCDSMQTFNMVNEYWELLAGSALAAQNSGLMIWNWPLRCHYVCSACEEYSYIFFVQFIADGEEEKEDKTIYKALLRKVGQVPAWEIEMDKNLENILGEHRDLYKKGLVNESQSYGIGAYSYYRRITEAIIDNLLEKISDLIEGEKKKVEYKKALEAVKKTRVAEEKINLVKGLLPESLRPDDLNPLNLLYEALSKGIHDKTDEECLEIAEEIRNVLVYLVNKVLYHQVVSKEFTESMRKILEDKSKN